jgi:lipid-binding SYLF domain-containing protein
MPTSLVRLGLVAGLLSIAAEARASDPEQTVRSANQVLREIMTIPSSQIPATLLSEARGVAIIPDVIKIGFVAGIRRGRGVVMVRGEDGQWTNPQFVTLTGGSVGWQAGVQGTDVVLVFMTPKSVEGLMQGKFTIGADASAAAGPVGRNAAAATDARLKAEILSYSHSRGLFAGLSLDGSAIEVDPNAQALYYQRNDQGVQTSPESAFRLRQDLTNFSQGNRSEVVQAPTLAVPSEVTSSRASSTKLASDARQLYAIIDPQWQKFLALPAEVFEGNQPPQRDALERSLQQFSRVADNPKYKSLNQRPEFQATYHSLRDAVSELSGGSASQITLPPPPER